MTQRILITGASGFIGCNLLASLKANGVEPVAYDCEPMTLSACSRVGDTEFILGDVTDFTTLRNVADSVAGIVHLAAVSRVIWGYQNPKLCINVNVGGTENVLEAARLSGRKPWIIYGSSREVYGEPERLPVTEDDPIRPINTYGLSKAFAERLCRLYHQRFGLSVGILRFSNVYGNACDQLDRVIPKFILNALNGREVSIEGGAQCFDFTHVDDVVLGIEAMISRMEEASDSKRPLFEFYHLVTGVPTTLQQLVEIIEDEIAKKLSVTYAPPRSYDVERFYGDPRKAYEGLGFRARIGIERGIAMTIDELRKVAARSPPAKPNEARRTAAFERSGR